MNYPGVILDIRRVLKNFQMKIPFALFAMLFLSLESCKEQPPVTTEGNSRLELTALWNVSGDTSVPDYQPLKNAKIILSSEYGIQIKQTDENGKLFAYGLPSSTYGISVRMQHPADPNIIIVGSIKNLEIVSWKTCTDTIIATPISSTGIAINEIHACGPVNNFFYFYDQFIELYNSSDSVKYLDGMMVMRVSGNNDGKGSGADEYNNGSIYGVYNVYKFPGKPGEKNYPFQPKKFLALAGDAVNHKNNVSSAVDLSHADWEFYNQYSATDMDNPSIPNLINMRPDITVDFDINLAADVIVISSGIDSVWIDGIDISTIIDGVQYKSNTKSKSLDDRVDKGLVLSPPRYSGKSMQRREPGLDTNNGTLDWEIISSATPGYQK